MNQLLIIAYCENGWHTASWDLRGGGSTHLCDLRGDVFYRKIMTMGRPTPSRWHTDSIVTDILPDSRKWEAGLSLLFFQRTRVGIPASILGGSQLSVTLAPGGQVSSLASSGICSPLPLSYTQIFKYAALLPIRTMWRSLRTEKKQLRYMCSKLQNKSKEQHKETKSVRTDWTLYSKTSMTRWFTWGSEGRKFTIFRALQVEEWDPKFHRIELRINEVLSFNSFSSHTISASLWTTPEIRV